MQTTALLIFVCMLASGSPAGAAILREIVMDTAPLAGHAAGPFSLNFQLNDGGGTGNGNNTVTLTHFMFDGGGPAGAAALFGGASGSLDTGVTITDTAFFNSFVQRFTPGFLLRFRLMLTTNVDSPVPDQFSFAILDSSGAEIPTQGLGATGSDVLLLVNLDDAVPELQTFATDALRFPVAGGSAIDIAAPVVIPEPSSLILMSTAGALLLLHRRSAARNRR